MFLTPSIEICSFGAGETISTSAWFSKRLYKHKILGRIKFYVCNKLCESWSSVLTALDKQEWRVKLGELWKNFFVLQIYIQLSICFDKFIKLHCDIISFASTFCINLKYSLIFKSKPNIAHNSTLFIDINEKKL